MAGCTGSAGSGRPVVVAGQGCRVASGGHSVRSSAVAARSVRETARETVRWRGGWARIGPWRGNREVGHVVVGTAAPPTTRAVLDCLDRLRALGYENAVTNALPPRDSLAFVDAGFEVRERLHLLEHLGDDVPGEDPALAADPPGPALRPGRRARASTPGPSLPSGSSSRRVSTTRSTRPRPLASGSG